MGNKMRRIVEREIVEAVVDAALAQGYDLQVHVYGEDLTARTRDRKTIIDMLMDLDDAFLMIRGTKTADDKHDGWVRFVFGNDGWDVVNDYTTNLDGLGIMVEADKLAEKYGD